MAPTLLLRMFGALRLESGNESITKFPTKRSALILARLAIAKGHRIGRDELAEMLWPDDFLDVTRLRLRQELRRLRQVVTSTGDLIHADRQSIELLPGCLASDVEMFEGLLASCQRSEDARERVSSLEQATQLAGGPFLSGFQEPWVLAIRRDYEGKLKQAWLDLAEAYQQTNRMVDALRAIQCAVRSSPLDLEANIALVRHLVGSGQPVQARQVVSDLDAMMYRGLGCRVPVSIRSILRETSKALEVATEVEARRLSTITRPRPLVGRDEAIVAIEALLARPGACVVLVGPFGVGKTHLVREIAWQFVQKTGLPCWEGGEPETVQDGLFLPDCNLADSAHIDQIRKASSRGWRVLTEARERLDTDFLSEFLVAPLPLPVLADSLSVTLQYPSVRLLTSKMFEAGATDITEQDASALAELARGLDGIPGPLKFFARRLTIQTPTEALESLRTGLDEFIKRQVDEKHEILSWLEVTLSAMSPDIQHCLFALTLLDGVSADLASKIFESLNSTEVFQVLERKCLIVVEDQGAVRRYRVLRPVGLLIRKHFHSQFSIEAERRVWQSLSDWAFDKSRLMMGPQQEDAFATTQDELANLRRALAWSIENDHEMAGKLVTGVWRVICARGNPSQEQDLVLAAARVGAELQPSKFAGEAWNGAAIVSTVAGKLDLAEEAFIAALQQYERIGDSGGIAWVSVNYAEGVIAHRDINLATLMAKKAAVEAKTKDVRAIALCFYSFGLAEMQRVAEAIQVGEEVFATRMQSSDLTEQARAYSDLAELYRRVGQPEAARPLLEEGVRRLRKTGIQDMLFDALISQIALRNSADNVQLILDEAHGIAQKMGADLKRLQVARLQVQVSSRHREMARMLSAIEVMLRLTQANQSLTEIQRSFRCIGTEFDFHRRFEYANVIWSILGEPVNGPVHAGWKVLLSTDSAITKCILANVMAKEAFA